MGIFKNEREAVAASLALSGTADTGSKLRQIAERLRVANSISSGALFDGAQQISASIKELETLASAHGAQVVADATIKAAVDLFLGWKLPSDFCPDAGISFKATYNEDSVFGPSRHEPTGTNLLTAAQAEQMLRYVLAAPSKPSLPEVTEAARRG